MRGRSGSPDQAVGIPISRGEGRGHLLLERWSQPNLIPADAAAPHAKHRLLGPERACQVRPKLGWPASVVHHQNHHRPNVKGHSLGRPAVVHGDVTATRSVDHALGCRDVRTREDDRNHRDGEQE
jgi:hypothetical protein